MPNISILEASLAYEKAVIFEKLQFSIQRNHWTAILGPSGIGKTSLLKLMAGLLPDTSTTVSTLKFNNTSWSIKDIAYLPQEDLLLPWLSVYNNLLIGTKLNLANNKKDAHQEANDLLAKVKLTHAKTLFPYQLSGGMRQRLGLARLLLQDKPIILMDEPFKSLDAMTRFHLQALAVTLFKNKTVIFITHDLQEAARLAHTIYFMDGKPAKLMLAATLKDPIPRELTAESVINIQKDLYPLWSNK